MADTIDFYQALEIDPNATQQQIRDAYKKAALKHHPDRVPSDSPERGPRTKKFQQINAAYYSLSDPTRRRDYDASRPFQDSSQAEDPLDADEEIPRTPGGFPWSAFFGSSAKPNAQEQQEQEERYSDTQFSSAFEEMLREEGMAEGQPATPTKKFWSLIGGVSGAAMGFIVANMPGAVAGAVAGNRLGAVRDAKGKSVYEVFKELPQNERGRLLTELAGKVFAQVASGV